METENISTSVPKPVPQVTSQIIGSQKTPTTVPQWNAIYPLHWASKRFHASTHPYTHTLPICSKIKTSGVSAPFSFDIVNDRLLFHPNSQKAFQTRFKEIELALFHVFLSGSLHKDWYNDHYRWASNIRRMFEWSLITNEIIILGCQITELVCRLTNQTVVTSFDIFYKNKTQGALQQLCTYVISWEF